MPGQGRRRGRRRQVRGFLAAAALLALPALVAPRPAAADELIFQNVVVRQGDTLWGIANRYLKDPARWDEILKHNKLPSSDPTVALPGMVLRVPIKLIKENLRAAHLITMINRVLFRRKDTADWKAASKDMELFQGDSLRTLDDSKAKVRFLNADLLGLDPNSMAIIKPQGRDYDVELKTGGLFVGKSKVVTASARVTPKTQDTQYSAKVRPDLSTLVEVYTGVAAVEGQGKVVDVKAGMQSEVKLGFAPGAPTRIPDLPSFEARAAEFAGSAVVGQARVKAAEGAQLALGAGADEINKAADAAALKNDVSDLSIGVPISGYRVQASRTRGFENLIYDKVYEPDERVDFTHAGLPPGVYWFRIILIDLLGTEEKPSAPRLYSIGLGGRPTQGEDLKLAFVLYKPAKDEDTTAAVYKVSGLLKADGLTVSVNGRPARVDEQGNFFSEVKLAFGANEIAVVVTDPRGNSSTLTRRITRY